MNKQSGSDASIAGPSRPISSDVETNSSSDKSFTVPAARNTQTRKRAFCLVWLEDPAFKPWLQQLPSNPYKGKCSICNVTIKAMKSNLLRHGNTQEHIKNMKYGKTSVARSTNESTSADEAISMDVGNESSSDCTFTVVATKKRRRQPFVLDWLEDPAFKPWLEQVQDDPYKGKCTFCYITIKAKKCNLQQHANSQKHIDNIKYGQRVVPGEGTRTFTDEVKEAEIRVCTDAIEHNIPFNSFDHYVRLSQKVFPNPNVLKRMSLSGKKIKAITLNVINKSIVGRTIEKIQDKYFSVLIDETTDVSNMKLLCFLIRYVHNEQICTDLLDLVRINEATAENIYRCFRHSLNKFNLPITNMVGVGVDNANATVGARNSLTSRIAADNGEICIIPCLCHSIDLAARHACQRLPPYIEKFLHSLYSYISQSPKGMSILEDTQQFMKVATRKVTQPSATRWLALSECLKTVLNQWTVLFSVLEEASAGKDEVAMRIFSAVNCPYTKAYLQFMDYILITFTQLSKLFRSSKVLIHRLLPECYRLLKSLGGNFIQSKYLKEPNIHKINVNNVDNLLPPANIFTGTGCKETLSEIANDNLEEHEDVINFYINIQQCYQTAFQNIVNRVPFDDTFLNALYFLDPKTALDTDQHVEGQLKPILNKFKSKFNHQLVINEWYLLPFTFLEEAKEKLQVMSLPQFWHEISIATNAEDEYILPNISKLAQLCLSLPHSNADVERYFSTVTQVRTIQRNRLNPDTVTALARIKLDMKKQNAHCYDYKLTDDMLHLFNDSMYKEEKIPDELIGILLPDEMNKSDSDDD